MALQYSTAIRNAKLNAVESTTGAAAILRFFTGALPADCTVAPTGVKQAEGVLPADWMTDASAASKSKAGTWTVTGVAGVSTANATWFGIYDPTGTTRHVQGTLGTTGTDMIVDNASIAAAQVVTVASFTLNDPNG